jgi:isoleucyl-tRNA synthetase
MANFKKVDLRKKYSEMEKEIIDFWRKDGTFEKSVNQRDKKDAYVFYDGPPFITGEPHYGTLLSSVVKDVVPRYWTMKGKRVERIWGWDCHGLPAENLVEKKLGIKDKRDVTKVGLEKYIQTCHKEMVQGGSEWEDTIERIGRWVEFKNAYKTMDKEYMESVWWAFNTLYEKGKIYEGEKVLMYCTRCATPISKAEVAMDNSYKEVTDPSVYVKFKLKSEKNKYLLAWTTTPWTLPSNSAIAINENIKYSEVEYENEILIMADSLVETVMTDEKHKPLDYKKTNTYLGKELLGEEYEPIFDIEIEKENVFKIWHADFVHDEEGTGVAHESPAYGEEDYELSKENNFPWIMSTDENGNYLLSRWKGKNVWEVNKEIAKTLKEEGVVFKIDYIQHDYPHCHRCETKLMYRAHPSWFMDIDGQRSKMLEENSNINWFPEHFKDKRFKNTVETAPDWNLSRDRFWATPIPVWRGKREDGTIVEKVVGSYQELKELSGKELDDYHLPYVDEVTFEYEGVELKRVEKVMDCWFESGSMPFAQFHYPFENKEKFEENFPGDFISEYVGQVRAWFYYLHAVSVGIFGKEAFKNVVVTGVIAGNDGKKMSKSLGNYTDPNILLDEYSSDALRYLLVSSPLLNGEDFALIDKDVSDIQRKLGTLWNSYGFFVMYANVDNWSPENNFDIKENKNLLDKWIVSRLHEIIRHVDDNMQTYNLPAATKPIVEFIDDLSNWYIRRSRKRFWKPARNASLSDAGGSENGFDDVDKTEAYQTLYYVLVELSKVMAPFTPFVSEEIYGNLVSSVSSTPSQSSPQRDEEALSVHLCDFPVVDESLIDESINKNMQAVREIVNNGLQLRAKNQIKVRQPLSELKIVGYELSEELLEIIKEEVNVKHVAQNMKQETSGDAVFWDNEKRVGLNTEINHELKLEGQAREVIRHIQQMRKEAGYDVDNRIEIWYDSKSEVFEKFGDLIAKETLAEKVHSKELNPDADLEKEFEIDGGRFTVGVKK